MCLSQEIGFAMTVALIISRVAKFAVNASDKEQKRRAQRLRVALPFDPGTGCAPGVTTCNSRRTKCVVSATRRVL